MQISDDTTCAYHMCDRTGHSVCHTVADHYQRLTDAITAALPLLPTETAEALGLILAECPDTSTTT